MLLMLQLKFSLYFGWGCLIVYFFTLRYTHLTSIKCDDTCRSGLHEVASWIFETHFFIRLSTSGFFDGGASIDSAINWFPVQSNPLPTIEAAVFPFLRGIWLDFRVGFATSVLMSRSLLRSRARRNPSNLGILCQKETSAIWKSHLMSIHFIWPSYNHSYLLVFPFTSLSAIITCTQASCGRHPSYCVWNIVYRKEHPKEMSTHSPSSLTKFSSDMDPFTWLATTISVPEVKFTLQ